MSSSKCDTVSFCLRGQPLYSMLDLKIGSKGLSFFTECRNPLGIPSRDFNITNMEYPNHLHNDYDVHSMGLWFLNWSWDQYKWFCKNTFIRLRVCDKDHFYIPFGLLKQYGTTFVHNLPVTFKIRTREYFTFDLIFSNDVKYTKQETKVMAFFEGGPVHYYLKE